MDLVSIYVPTYRRIEVFETVLVSYLRQTHENIMIHIYDNSCAESYSAIKDLVRSVNDKRVKFVENTYQLGAHGNYDKILSNIRSDSLTMVIPSDVGLAQNAIEILVQSKKDNGASVIFPAYRTYDISSLKEWSSFSFDSHPHQKSLLDEDGLVSAYELLYRFFGSENIKGEFSGFSFFGALFEGELAQRLSSRWRRFKYHGAEQFVSMNLLLRAQTVYLLNQDLLFNLFGHPRLGGTERMKEDIGRIECLLASQEILDNFDFWLFGQGMDLTLLRQAQIAKAKHFMKNYKGFQSYARDVILKNTNMLEKKDMTF